MKPKLVAEIFWYDDRLQTAYRRLSHNVKNYEAMSHFIACAHAAARYTEEERTALINGRADPNQTQTQTQTQVLTDNQNQLVAE